MNEHFHQTFDAIFQILDDHGLVEKNNFNEEKKKEAFERCFPFLLRFQKLSIENDLYHNIETILELLNISIEDKANFKEIFSRISREILMLKHSLAICQNDLNELKLKIFSDELKMIAYEIVNLFRYYYVDDQIKSEYSYIKNWSQFTDQWGKREMVLIKSLNKETRNKFDEEIQNDPSIVQWVSPIERRIEKSIQLSLNLLDLRKIANQRHGIAHQDIRSIEDQRDFIEKCQQIEFSEDYEFSNILKKMVDHLAALDADITNTKLESLH